jgi:hypothetical protein
MKGLLNEAFEERFFFSIEDTWLHMEIAAFKHQGTLGPSNHATLKLGFDVEGLHG